MNREIMKKTSFFRFPARYSLSVRHGGRRGKRAPFPGGIFRRRSPHQRDAPQDDEQPGIRAHVIPSPPAAHPRTTATRGFT